MTVRGETKREKRLGYVPWMMLLCCLVGELFFYTWCRVQSMKVGYEITRLQDRQKELLLLEKNLTIELAHLRSPQRLSKIAATRFDLQMPTPEQVILLP